jgi:hypothetical protein
MNFVLYRYEEEFLVHLSFKFSSTAELVERICVKYPTYLRGTSLEA